MVAYTLKRYSHLVATIPEAIDPLESLNVMMRDEYDPGEYEEGV